MSDGQLVVRLVPIVKEQNRINAAAYTERPLSFYAGDPEKVRSIEIRFSEEWRSLGQTMFMNVVASIADLSGVSIEEVKQNVASSPVNAFDIGIPSFVKDMVK